MVAYDRSQSEQEKGDTLPVYAGLLQIYDGDVTKGKHILFNTFTYYVNLLACNLEKFRRGRGTCVHPNERATKCEREQSTD